MEERILRRRVLVVKGMASGCLDGQGVLQRTRRSSRVLVMRLVGLRMVAVLLLR